jgi:hypothetical protein
LYGIPESGLHWFMTYMHHHRTELGMNQARADKCFLYRRDDGGISVTTLQVDDSFGTGTPEFLQDEENHSLEFRCKPRQLIETGGHVMFNGSEISKGTGNVYKLQQKRKLQSVREARLDEELVSTRAAIQYIATCVRPDLCAPCQLLSSQVGTAPDKNVYKKLNKLVDVCHCSVADGLTFVPLDLDSVRVAVFTDASFANCDDYKSQLGFVICMKDKTDAANIVHFGSSKCRRITRSVMAAELHGLVMGFDHAFMVASILQDILQREIAIDGYIDSKTVFDTVTRLASTMEKRLQIDVAGLQESHMKGELRSLYWIPSEQNYSDPLTKESYQKESALRRLMCTNRIQVTPSGWVRRIDDRTREHAT